MSHGTEKKETQTRRNARRLVSGELNAKNCLWQKIHPQAHRDAQLRYKKRSKLAKRIEKEVNPLTISTDAIFIAGDVHVPFHDPGLVEELCDRGKEAGVKKLALIGDTWDCDNYSKFIRYTNRDLTFDDERDWVREILLQLQKAFPEIYISKGNHEKRWIALNQGNMDIFDLFLLTQVENLQITMDDYIYITMKGEKWRLCHPKSYRQIPLSLPKDLAAKHGCNIISFHGHHFAQGWDRSGRLRIAEGGGLFDEGALDYQRETYAGPRIKSGFYLLADGDLIAYEGR